MIRRQAGYQTTFTARRYASAAYAVCQVDCIKL